MAAPRGRRRPATCALLLLHTMGRKKLPFKPLDPGSFPKTSNAEVGFHHAFSTEREKRITEAQAAAAALSTEAIRKDPELECALQNLRSRVGWINLRSCQPQRENL